MTTTEMTMRTGGWTPEFDSVCASAEVFTIATREMIRQARLSTRDSEVRAEIEAVLETLDEVATMLSVGDVEMAVWMASDVSRAWQQFAVDHACADDVTDVDLIRWSRISNALVEVESRSRFGMLVWMRRGR